MSFRPSDSERRNLSATFDRLMSVRLSAIISFTDRFLHAFACAHLVEMTVGTMFGMVEITGVVEMTNMIAFCAEGALILTSTRSGAAHFTPLVIRLFYGIGSGRYFTCRRHISHAQRISPY